MERAAWTDQRLDDLSQRVESGFERVDRQFSEMRGEIRDGFAELRAEMRDGFERADRDSREVRTILVRVGGGIIVGLIGVIAAVLASGA